MPIAVVPNSEGKFVAWRSVESQQAGATLSLVNYDRDAHDILESILDSAKPAIPEQLRDGCQHLHYLLFSPFRYCQSSVQGTRFGRPNTRGIFYAADFKETALVETGYWRTRFLSASEGLRSQQVVSSRTLFSVQLGGVALDLRQPPYNDDPQRWMHSSDYSATWEIGDAIRKQENVLMIRYSSVRDLGHRGCVAVFWPEAFQQNTPLQTEQWIMHAFKQRVVFTQQEKKFEFNFSVT